MTACNDCRYRAGSLCDAPGAVTWYRIESQFIPETGRYSEAFASRTCPSISTVNIDGSCPHFKPTPMFKDGWRQWLGFHLFGGVVFLNAPTDLSILQPFPDTYSQAVKNICEKS